MEFPRVRIVHERGGNRGADFGRARLGTSVATVLVVAHTPTGPVEQVPGDESAPSRHSGPRFPRPHLQRIETEPGLGFPKRLATGSIAPPLAEGTHDEFLDEDKTPVGSLDTD